MEPAVAEATRQLSHAAYISNLPYEFATSQLEDLIRTDVLVEPVQKQAFADCAQMMSLTACELCAGERRIIAEREPVS